MKLTIVAGARPNFIKIAPIIHAIEKSKGELSYELVHTGQHFDKKMSETFFEELNIPSPKVNLQCGGGTQAEQTAGIMVAFEKFLKAHPSDLVLVVGDVTSTMACTIVAKKLHIKVAHVEAGIRSGDILMPEEINRLVTDSITDYFFTTTTWASQNLKKTGVPKERIFFVGNVMIDTLRAQWKRFKMPDFWKAFGLRKKAYWVLTLHRPANVDQADHLANLLQTICHEAGDYPVIFPIHPRTRLIFQTLDLSLPNLYLVEPLPYLNFNFLVRHSLGVITDSGGITEETTVMKVPCLTLRDSTERPETVKLGTNELIGNNPKDLVSAMQRLLKGKWKKGKVPPKWDGKAALRIINILEEL